MSTVYSLLRERAALDPGAVALAAPGRPAATYECLLRQVEQTHAALNAAGLGRADRIATVLRNGPDMAAAFLSVAAGAVCAPLNPAYRETEFAFYLGDLKPRALMVDEEAPAAALAAASALEIPVVRLAPRGESGVFRLEHTLGPGVAASSGFSEPDDPALVLHTSGTTSRPKLVVLTNANLWHSARNIRESLALGAADRCLNVMPLFHIHGLAAAVLASVAAGGSVVCTPGFVATRFFEWMDEFGPTWYTAVPTMHQAIVARSEANRDVIGRRPLRFIRSCSAALPPRVLADLESAFQAPVVEAYGMTEAAHQVASNPLPPRVRKPGSVGLAAGPEVAIAPDGEVLIRGANVTPGYDHNPEANRSAFEGGWFRTGDRGSIDEDGYLFLSGRTKEMINRGGEKISPREIDEALLEHPAVAQALAFAILDPRLGEDVAAAVVLKEGAAAAELELQEFAAARLADFKVPRRIVFLDEIPKGPTGKPQRIGLAERLGVKAGAPARPEYLAPRTPTEAMLCALWQSVLKVERVGVLDSFFDVGGDSVLAAQVLARAAVPPVVFFAAPTVERMANWLDSGARGAAGPLATGPRTAEAPLSFAQERIWFLEQLEGDRAPYLRTAAWRLQGPLDEAALKRSLDAIVERHQVLRTTYHGRQGVPVQVIGAPRPVPFDQDVRRPFDLERDLMLRASLVRHGAQDHTLSVAMHHIASDGWSSRVFLRELAALYRGETLPALPIQYADYARWQRERPLDEGLAAYWKQKLAGLPALLDLPADRPRPPQQRYRSAREAIVLPAAVVELARAGRATLFMTLAAALAVLLYRYSGSEDIALGCPAAGRSSVETEGLIGLFVNTLVLRADLSGEPGFRELLARVKETAIGAYAHDGMPFEKLVEMLDPPRSLSYSPLFQVMFQLRNLPSEATALGEAAVEPIEMDPGTAPFDLCFDVAPETLRCTLDYNTDLFDAGTAARMLRHYASLIESAAAQADTPVSRLRMLTGAERRQVLVDWNQTAREHGENASLVELFEAQARRTPEALAVSAGTGKWTYRRLNEEATRLARHLRGVGVGPETVVGVCLERSPRSVMTLIAIRKAGGAFLPLDPSYPAERLAFMLADSGAPVLVTERKLLAGLPDRLPRTVLVDGKWGEGPEGQAPQGGLAYVIYTSGSTGKPKGVLCLEQGLLNRLHWMWRQFPFEAGEVCCQRTPLSFVDSVAEIFGPLLQGVPLEILPDETVKGSTADLVRALERCGATRIVVVPSLLAAILEQKPALPRLKTWFSSGEALTPELAAQFARLVPHGRLINLYGSSEVSADITWQEAAGTAGIGRPIDNTQVYVLDALREPVPVGVPGELHAGGAGLARGYLNRPELTAERFIDTPLGRLFRTGDRARWLPDGTLEFLGRTDGQVKLRGCRVELGEVEAALEKHPQVQAAAAALRRESLVAYVCAVDGLTATELRSHSSRWLPDYMVPNRVVFLRELPRLPNGKVDRRALPSPDEAPRDSTAPRDQVEARLAGIWEELVGRRPVGIHDNFFDLGGHSLLAARMSARISEEFGATVGIRTLFEAQTVAQLAAALRNGNGRACPRLFWVGGGAFLRPLLDRMDGDSRIVGLTFDEQDAEELGEPCTVPGIAASLARKLRTFQSAGPYYLAGYSLQGLYAWELARQLREQGDEVRLLALVDTFLPVAARSGRSMAARAWAHVRSFARQTAEGQFAEFGEHVREIARIVAPQTAAADGGGGGPASLRDKLRGAAAQYVPGPVAAGVVFFEAESQPLGREAGTRFGWAELAGGGWKLITVPGRHLTMLDPALVDTLARELEAVLQQAGCGHS